VVEQAGVDANGRLEGPWELLAEAGPLAPAPIRDEAFPRVLGPLVLEAELQQRESPLRSSLRLARRGR
jgi:hypothetical protein